RLRLEKRPCSQSRGWREHRVSMGQSRAEQLILRGWGATHGPPARRDQQRASQPQKQYEPERWEALARGRAVVRGHDRFHARWETDEGLGPMLHKNGFCP